jgi:hypothetical protein
MRSCCSARCSRSPRGVVHSCPPLGPGTHHRGDRLGYPGTAPQQSGAWTVTRPLVARRRACPRRRGGASTPPTPLARRDASDPDRGGSGVRLAFSGGSTVSGRRRLCGRRRHYRAGDRSGCGAAVRSTSRTGARPSARAPGPCRPWPPGGGSGHKASSAVFAQGVGAPFAYTRATLYEAIATMLACRS